MIRLRVKSHLTREMRTVNIIDEPDTVRHDNDEHEFAVIEGDDGKLYLPLASQADIGRAGRPGLYLVGSKQRPSFINMSSRRKVTDAQIKKRGTSKEYHCIWSKSERGKPQIFDEAIYLGEVYDMETLQ